MHFTVFTTEPKSSSGGNRAHVVAPLRLAALLIAMGTSAGCQPLPAGGGAQQTSPPRSGVAAATSNTGAKSTPASVFDRPAERLTIEFLVHRIWATPGTFSRSTEPWSLATGAPPPAEAALRLAANGFRLRVGQASDRPALRQFLDSIENRSAEDRAIPDDRRALEILLSTGPAVSSLFYYAPDGSLTGREFESARAILWVRYQLHAVNLREIVLEVMPELEEPPGPPKWEVGEDGHMRQVPQERRHRFDDLNFSVKIPENGFLLVGATPNVQDMPVLGRAFFQDYGGKPEGAPEELRESLYIISPIIRSSSDATGPEAGTGQKPAGGS